jgi:hypothetical protein
LGILADLDEVAVGTTHVAALFPAVIVQRLGKKERCSVAEGKIATGQQNATTGLKPAIILMPLRGAKAPLFHVTARI